MCSDGLSLDVVLDLCSHRRRRRVLDLLGADGVPMPLSDLARGVAATDGDCSPSAAIDSENEHRRVAIALAHVHVPKLAAAGVVTHDRERGVVAPGEHFSQVASVLDGLPR